jgi:hypothetical protein
MLKKKGQATGAAVLVAIIAILIILYILFLPPEERAELLKAEEGGGAVVPAGENISLLEANPGRLTYLSQREIEHAIPSVSLNIWAEGTVIKELDSVYVSSSLFGKNTKEISFTVDDVENIENVLLNFIVKEADGRLIIKINENEVYNNVITTANIEPIKLDEFLEKDNVIEISASAPGALFWKKNKYLLEGVTVTGDILRKEAQESRNIFVVSRTEKDNLEKVTLKFLPECDPVKVGRLKVVLNDYEIYSAVPDCGLPIPAIELAPNYLYSGENELIFRTERGNYLMDRIRLVSYLEKIEYPVYYFELSAEEYDDVQAGKADVNDVTYKQGKIIVNGHTAGIDQTGIDYLKDLDDWIVRGSNSVKVEPSKTIDIASLKVVLES